MGEGSVLTLLQLGPCLPPVPVAWLQTPGKMNPSPVQGSDQEGDMDKEGQLDGYTA